jgi:hypothetical protein
MSIKCFFKYFAFALGVQIGLIILSVWFYYVGVFLFIYWPWLWLGDQLFGPGGAGGHAMAGSAILGGLLGLVAYSILAGVIICLFKARRQVQ